MLDVLLAPVAFAHKPPTILLSWDKVKSSIRTYIHMYTRREKVKSSIVYIFIHVLVYIYIYMCWVDITRSWCRGKRGLSGFPRYAARLKRNQRIPS